VKASHKSIKRRLNFYLASLCILRGWFVGEKVKMRRGWRLRLRDEEMGDITLSSLRRAAVECGSISRRQEGKRDRVRSEEEQ
jgi:hypothetical protein